MKKILFALLTALLISNVISAQNRLTPELLWELDRIGAPHLSPDGNQLLFTVTDFTLEEDKGRTDIYLMNAEGGAPVKLTGKLANSAFHPEWRPDGKRIGFLSVHDGTVQLFEMDPESKEHKVVSAIEGGISGFHYAPTQDKIVFATKVKLDQTVADRYPDLPKASGRIIDELMYRHWDNWDDFKYSHVFYQSYDDGELQGSPTDIMEGERYDCPMQPFDGSEDYTFSPDGKKIAYTCKKLIGKDYAESTNSEIYEYDIESGKTAILSSGRRGYDKVAVYSPKGDYVIWSGMATPGYESDKNEIVRYDTKSGETSVLLAKVDQSADHLTFGSKGKYIYFRSGKNARYQLWRIPVDGGKPEQLTKGTHNFNSFAVGKKQIIAQRSTMQEPNELYIIDIKEGNFKAITRWNKNVLDKLDKATIREKWLETTNGEKMHVWIVLPPNFDSTKTYPTLLYCQGGPQSAISQYFSFRWNFELMAANNYIIIAPNRHGLPTFGQQWNQQISGDWGGQAMKDYFTAIDWAAELDYIDGDRLGAVGASFGGYSVYWLAGNHDNRFKCFISHCGLYNLESWYTTTEELFFANFDLKSKPWEGDTKTYEQFNPANYIKKWNTPIMVIHNQKDFRVPLGEGMQAFNAAQIRGIDSRFLYFPDEGHWVLGPQNGVLWHREYFRWLDEHLKD